MLSFGKTSKQTHMKKICQLKSQQLLTSAVEIPATEEIKKKICCADVTNGDGLFLKGQIPQYDRVDNHSRDMDKLSLLLNKNIVFFYKMINTLNLSNILFNKILIGKQKYIFFMI